MLQTGPFQQGMSRKIIARFHQYGDLSEIMNNRQYLLANISVGFDYPEKWKTCRRQLCPIFQLAKSKDQYKYNYSFQKDRLIIDGKEFTAAPRSNLAELTQNVQPRNTAEKQNESILCFLGSHSVFSNLNETPF